MPLKQYLIVDIKLLHVAKPYTIGEGADEKNENDLVYCSFIIIVFIIIVSAFIKCFMYVCSIIIIKQVNHNHLVIVWCSK